MIWIPAFAGMTNTINHPHPPPTGRQAALSRQGRGRSLLMRDRKDKNGLVSELPTETSPDNTPLLFRVLSNHVSKAA